MDLVRISHVGVGEELSCLSIRYMTVMLQPHLQISLWARTSWTQGKLQKLIQDESWPLEQLLKIFPETKGAQ